MAGVVERPTSAPCNCSPNACTTRRRPVSSRSSCAPPSTSVKPSARSVSAISRASFAGLARLDVAVVRIADHERHALLGECRRRRSNDPKRTTVIVEMLRMRTFSNGENAPKQSFVAADRTEFQKTKAIFCGSIRIRSSAKRSNGPRGLLGLASSSASGVIHVGGCRNRRNSEIIKEGRAESDVHAEHVTIRTTAGSGWRWRGSGSCSRRTSTTSNGPAHS